MLPKIALAMDPDKTRHVINDEVLDRFAKCGDLLRREPFADFADPAARRMLAQTDILVTGWGCPMISPEILRSAPNLKLIAHAAGTVKYTIDPSAYAAGIRVTHAAEANALPVAEYTLASIIFANKRVFDLRDLYRADPGRESSHRLMDEPIGNFRRTVGLIGASRIGRHVIRMLGPFDFDVLLYDPFVQPGDPDLAGVEVVSLDVLLARSDVVSIHAPLLPSTRGMIAGRQLKLMKDGATLINTARGLLVDETALVAELETGRIQAIIDVTHPEPPPAVSPLFSLPNVFLTPHVAGAVGTERLRLGMMMADEVERFARGKPMLYEILPELLERLA